ncbi:GntR family transcriptional regulator [Streptomyces niveiscabiei]|uniref:GntR family transcriptional regulator n=1 Tax=Streptomyces niveiscabiei TaxID=164115 RepID=A0ABW9I8A3_9ACTN
MTAQDRIQRRPTKTALIAERLAEDIRKGRYKVGDKLPSEAQMEAMFGVSKPTIRTALAELRRMELIEPQQGRGSIVISTGGTVPESGITRSVGRTTRGGWVLPEPAEVEAPAISRTTLDGPPAAYLGQQDQDAISVDRTLYDPDTGARTAHRTLIPMATAAKVPTLAETPDMPTSDLYDQLTRAGFDLEFTEHVTARSSFPDERSALGMTDLGPLLISYRITADPDHGALLCEELKAPASTCQLSFPITPAKAPAKRPSRRRSASE